MAKIRGVKPEFWTDERVVEVSRDARLLFIGMWNFACDNGHLDDKPKQLKMKIFPGDSDTNIEAWLDELVTAGRIIRDGTTITIPKFAEHQKPHKRWWTTCDLPLCVVPDGAAQHGNNRGATVVKPGKTVAQPYEVDCEVDCDGEVDGEKAAAPQPGKPSAPKATRIPDVFPVTDSMRSWAAKNGFDYLDLVTITDEFVDFWRGATKNATKADWVATWRNRVREVAKREGPKVTATAATNSFWTRRPFEAAANE